jgi:hypothetical protein
MITSTPQRSGRWVVGRRRSTLDAAYDVALARLPVELRPPVRRYLENLREAKEIRKQGDEIRMAVTSAMCGTGVRWQDVDQLVMQLNRS